MNSNHVTFVWLARAFYFFRVTLYTILLYFWFYFHFSVQFFLFISSTLFATLQFHLNIKTEHRHFFNENVDSTILSLQRIGVKNEQMNTFPNNANALNWA